MKKRRLGGSTLEVSVVGLGGNNFGGRIDFTASRRVVGKAIELGINLIDTADSYGDKGGSEEYGATEPPLVHPGGLGHWARVSPRISRASSGVAISRPNPRAMLTMRSTRTALFLANSPGAI